MHSTTAKYFIIGIVLLFFSCSHDQKLKSGDKNIAGPEIKQIAATGYAYHQIGGNRVSKGKLNVANAKLLQQTLPSKPAWIAGLAHNGHAYWLVVLETGQLLGFKQTAAMLNSVSVLPDKINGSVQHLSPLVALDSQEQLYLANVIVGDQYAANTLLIDHFSGERLFIAQDGQLGWIHADGDSEYLPIQALINGRIIRNTAGTIAILSHNGKDRYSHDVLGNQLSTTSQIQLITMDPSPQIIHSIQLQGSDVFEGNALLWADIDRDGSDELVTTVSNSSTGAWIEAFHANGDSFAKSEPIGGGFFWRHLIGVIDFVPGQDHEILSTMTPHIGGVTEILSRQTNQLVQNSKSLGVTSHQNRSNNIDKAVAGDFDEDDQAELLIPSETYQSLVVIQPGNVVNECCQTGAQLSMDGTLITNIASVQIEGKTIIAVANQANLRIWYE